MKYIIFDTPKGQYKIKLIKIAEHRANYYSIIDNFNKGSDDWKQEVDYVMNDNFEGIGWILNNTDFEDWADVCEKINDKVLVTDNDFWTSSDNFEIKEL